MLGIVAGKSEVLPSKMVSLIISLSIIALTSAIGYNWIRLDNVVEAVATIRANRFTTDDGNVLQKEVGDIKQQLAKIDGADISRKVEILTEQVNKTTAALVGIQSNLEWLKNATIQQQVKQYSSKSEEKASNAR